MVRHARIKMIDTRKVTSAAAVLKTLETLNQQMSGSQLESLAPFNTAYSIVTRAIKQASDNDYFANPKFIETFSVCFANYYFEAINDFLRMPSVIAPAWGKVIASDKALHRPNFISLLMGANAHINYDLALALKDTLNKDHEKELFKDVIKIDQLLMKSGRQILDTFHEPWKPLDFLKRHFQFLYFRPVMYMILFWRVIAWRNYKALVSNRLDANHLRERSTKIAHRFVWLGARFGSS